MKTMTKFSSVTWISILLVLCFFSPSACKKPETAWKGEIKTVDGVKVVHNFEPDPEESFKPIEFIVDLSIGEEEDDENYMFSAPRDIDADTQGNLYVLDIEEQTIKKYNPQGKHIKNISRAGQGPGEFEYPRHLCISELGNIYVADVFERKIEVFNLEGEYQRAINLKNLDEISVTRNEELIVGAKYPEKGKKDEIQYSYKVGKYDQQKNEVLDFFSQEQLRTARVSDGTFTFEYPLFVRWDINSQDHIVIATANKYEMNVFTPAGELLFKFSLDRKPIPVKDEVKRKISDILKRLRIGLGIDDPEIRKIVDYHPMFNSISIDEKDRIWIEHYEPFFKDKPRTETTYDVFSPDGKFLFSTQINQNVYPQLIFKNGYIYTLARDKSGYEKALRLRIIEE
ncbi:MAG: 6-bladed beta-propeller [Candidatus Aminicenantes bacterium]|jgi:hypothetical protein